MPKEIELDDFIGKPCKSRVAFEFVPKRKQSLRLETVAERLRTAGVFVEVDTPFIVMLKIEGMSVSLFKSGKILVKQTRDEREARGIASRLAGMIKQ